MARKITKTVAPVVQEPQGPTPIRATEILEEIQRQANRVENRLSEHREALVKVVNQRYSLKQAFEWNAAEIVETEAASVIYHRVLSMFTNSIDQFACKTMAFVLKKIASYIAEEKERLFEGVASNCRGGDPLRRATDDAENAGKAKALREIGQWVNRCLDATRYEIVDDLFTVAV